MPLVGGSTRPPIRCRPVVDGGWIGFWRNSIASKKTESPGLASVTSNETERTPPRGTRVSGCGPSRSASEKTQSRQPSVVAGGIVQPGVFSSWPSVAITSEPSSNVTRRATWASGFVLRNANRKHEVDDELIAGSFNSLFPTGS
jgi:hypothetical protein